MISLLRKIRQKSVTENRVSKYFLYAIGEIVLVVIGILLALQVNTWKKENTNQNLKDTLLENLKTDLIIQKELIDEQILFENVVIRVTDSLIQFPNLKTVNKSLPNILNFLNGRKTFKANRTTFDNMIATGDITLLTNSNIQQEIIRYYQRLDYSESVTNNNNLFMTDSNYGAFVSNNALGFEIDENGKFVTDIQFSNQDRYLLVTQLNYRKDASLSIKVISEDLLFRTEELIQSIDEALK